jgi:hypothetical protein
MSGALLIRSVEAGLALKHGLSYARAPASMEISSEVEHRLIREPEVDGSSPSSPMRYYLYIAYAGVAC